MNDKDIQILMEFFEKKLQEKPTKEEAIRDLMEAGIIDAQGHFTKPYEHLPLLLPR